VHLLHQSGTLGRFDTVLHLGACSATMERDAAFLIRNNFDFTKDLAVWSLVNDARFVHASFATTYGDGAQGMSDTAPLEPFNALIVPVEISPTDARNRPKP
jgi:ADP-L-glycero-D-manno-heptose 6-epimerase